MKEKEKNIYGIHQCTLVGRLFKKIKSSSCGYWPVRSLELPVQEGTPSRQGNRLRLMIPKIRKKLRQKKMQA
jgi:hypothetical protein